MILLTKRESIFKGKKRNMCKANLRFENLALGVLHKLRFSPTGETCLFDFLFCLFYNFSIFR